jgi:hypothetical protein
VIADPWPIRREIYYLLNVPASEEEEALCIDLAVRPTAPQSGNAAPLKKLKLRYSQIPILPVEADRQLIRMLAGVTRDGMPGIYYNDDPEIRPRFVVEGTNASDLVRLMCQTGRCLLQTDPKQKEAQPIVWEEGEPWRLHLSIVPDKEGKVFRLEGVLRRGEQRMGLSEPQLLLPGGPIVAGGRAAALEDYGAFHFARMLAAESIVVPAEQTDQLLCELVQFRRLPRLELPPSLGVSEIRVAPQPRLRIKAPKSAHAWQYGDTRLHCQLSFAYDAETFAYEDAASLVFAPDRRQLIHRDPAAERQAIIRMRELGVRQTPQYQSQPGEFRIAPKQLPAAVRSLTAEHWHVEVDGKSYRQPGKIRIEVSSGIDWFELKGDADFEGLSVSLPALLRALKKGQNTIVLGDGTLGIVPEQWLKRYGLLAAVGDSSGDVTVQFGKNQAGLLDVLLAELPQVSFDEQFAQAREQLHRFEGVAPADPPAGFVGTLRPYQRDGLGWLNFLAEFGINGCLADDMGLGKTVQVLALLEQRRQQNKGPSLVVVPRSLVFNWHQEAARFTPGLRVLDHATADRLKTTDHFPD